MHDKPTKGKQKQKGREKSTKQNKTKKQKKKKKRDIGVKNFSLDTLFTFSSVFFLTTVSCRNRREERCLIRQSKEIALSNYRVTRPKLHDYIRSTTFGFFLIADVLFYYKERFSLIVSSRSCTSRRHGGRRDAAVALAVDRRFSAPRRTGRRRLRLRRLRRMRQ